MTMPIMSRRLGRVRAREGFSLTEVMMAMTLLAVILMSMARMSMVVSKRGRDNAIVAKRNFVLIEEANKFGAMPWTTLNAFSQANVTTKAGDFSYTRRLTITPVTSSRTTIKIVIVPTDDATRVDSVFVYRSLPPGSPLCVGC